MGNTLEIIRGTAILILGVLLFCVIFWFLMKKSEDPAKFLFRGILTVVLILPLMWFASRTGPFAPLIAAVAGLIATFIWGSTVGGLMAKPFTALFEGDSEPPEPKPVYSIAQAQRGKNNFHGALAAVKEQLVKFPNDYQGVLLMAQIYAEDFKDLVSARETIQNYAIGNPDLQVNVTNAWLQLADWYINVSDVQNASECFHSIIESYPGTNFAQVASQRLSHLETLHKPNTVDPVSFHAEDYRKNIGLEKSSTPKEPEAVGNSEITTLEERLTRYPQDINARETLALLYAERKDMNSAAAQLEYLLQQPLFNNKQKAHWLNMIADLAIKSESEPSVAEEAVKRIIAMAPGTAFAQQAQARLQYLTMEMKGNKKSQAIKLGSYDKDVGLKKS